MGWKGKAVAVAYLTLAASFVSTSSGAATCKSNCDDQHVTCANAGKSDDKVCLPQWRQCRMTCDGATKSVSATSQPVKVTTTTLIAPGKASGSKVVSTKTTISKH